MQITELAGSCGEWLHGYDGPHSNIVISSRVRLARNLAGRHFMVRLSPEQRAELAGEICDALGVCKTGGGLEYFDIESISTLERSILLERHLVSRELIEGSGRRGVGLNRAESLSLMVNEEDHLRLQSLRGGFRLEEAYSLIDELDNELAGILEYAYSPELGYLTSCPTNVGTGMRVSVMMHLPALVMTRNIERAFRAVHDLRLAVRGFYGEGTEALGELYQISNQITLGRSEREILDDLKAVIEELAAYEQRSRLKLLAADRSRLEDRVFRAVALLKSARVMSSEEAMQHLSSLRLGITTGIIPAFAPEELNRVFLFSQPAHLQNMNSELTSPKNRDIARAEFIRQSFANFA